MPQEPNRRQAMLAGAGALAAAIVPRATHAQDSKSKSKLCVFTKPFNSLSYEELAKQTAMLGVAGIEAPVRKGGNVEPEKVEEDLPKLVEALKSHGREITVLTSDINDITDPLSERVLRTAAKLGIKRYRMKYLRYDLDSPVLDQIKAWRPQLRDLAAMNRELGITAVYQNHAGGNQLGAALWDLPIALDGIARNEIGVAYDIRHATVEGGMSWPITFNRLRPHIEVVYVKDFKWDGAKPVNVPLGEGNVSKKFFSLLLNSDFTGPISLHEEYLDHKKPELVPQHLAAINKDVATLKSWIGS